MAAILKTENLSYVYGQDTPYEKYALKNVSLEINEGEIIGVIGHTGSGKSTLIQHFNGLLTPTSGKVYFRGEDIFSDKKKLRALRFKVGLVFQYPEYQLFEDTVIRDISFGPKNMGLSDGEAICSAENAARLAGIDESLFNKSPFELSGGQKRRVAIAGVMAMNPQVLILDEPAAGLDPRGRDMIFSMLKKYHEDTKSTIIIVSHSMEDIAKFSDRLLVMNNSEVFCFDTPQKVFAKSKELEEIHLDIPQITKIINKLKENNIDLGEGVFTVEEATKRILSRLKETGDTKC
jgi:energy-coupling factor transport system ATP-binding protein